MARLKRLLADGQRTPKHHLGLIVLGLVVERGCEAAEGASNIQMVRSEQLLVDDQRSPSQRLNLSVLASAERRASQLACSPSESLRVKSVC